ncbi:MAG: flavodoxin family protein [Chloroflexota bacterium]|nr:MAG: flavodoxin family protein [Chloroflexota bacterium]
MNALVVYFSKFGNTQKLAEVIAEGLTGIGDVRTVSSDELTVKDMKDADLLVMGSPTHNMNLPKSVKPVFENLPKRILGGTSVAAFDTSYKMSWLLNQFTASKRLVKKLRKLGGRPILPPEIFHVKEREGPLFEGELERAQAWAGSILMQLD